MFDDYAKKLENLGADVPKVFNKVALWGANKAVNQAKDITDREQLVDTGNYRRNWFAERIKPQKDIYGIELQNNAEYASFLEDGHRTRNGGRVKGRKVGRLTLINVEGDVLAKLNEEIEILMLQKKHGISRAEAKKYIN